MNMHSGTKIVSCKFWNLVLKLFLVNSEIVSHIWNISCNLVHSEIWLKFLYTLKLMWILVHSEIWSEILVQSLFHENSDKNIDTAILWFCIVKNYTSKVVYAMAHSQNWVVSKRDLNLLLKSFKIWLQQNLLV